jgi:hypothetical protein
VSDQGALFAPRSSGGVLLGFDVVAAAPPAAAPRPPADHPPRGARFTDPSTSFHAAERHRKSGRRSEGMRVALCIVLREPGLTYREVAARAPHELGQEGVEAQRRLDDLVKAGELMRGPKRKCRITGNRCQTWWPAGHPTITAEVA